MDLDDSRSQAIALKDKGNDAFKAHDYPAAVDFYTKAIGRYDKEPSFYTNRAQVRRPIPARGRVPCSHFYRRTSGSRRTVSPLQTRPKPLSWTRTMSRFVFPGARPC